MRIVYFDFVFERERPGLSGLSDLIWNWTRHMVRLGEEVHLVAPYTAKTRPPEGAIVHTFEPPPFAYRNIFGQLLLVLRGWQEIARLGPVDILHMPEYVSTGLFSLLNHNPKTALVLTVPGNIYERIQNGNPFDIYTTQVYKLTATLSARRCTRILAISADQQQWWVRTGAHPDKVTVLHHGVDTTRFRPIPHARQMLGLSEHAPILLYVGRLSAEKGVLYLPEALAQIRQQHPTAQLHIVGDGPLRATFQTACETHAVAAHVFYHGWQDQPQLPLWYAAADVCLVPSLSEPLGRVVMEAMACGCPVLCTSVGGMIDLVRHEDTGVLVAPGDPHTIAEGVCQLLANPTLQKTLTRNALAYVYRELALEQIMQYTRDEIYRSLVAG